MTLSSGGYKVFDKVFFYPVATSSLSIEIDAMRLFVKEHLNYAHLVASNNLIFVYAAGVGKRPTLDLINRNKGKKIIFIYSGENIHGHINLISHVHAFLKKLGLKTHLIEKLLFNKVSLSVFSIPSPYQIDSYFKYILKKKTFSHYFILTNDIGSDACVFFSPYFYFFCQDRIHKITKFDRSKVSNQKRFCCFIVSNPNNPDRIRFYKKLAAYKPIDSFGKIFNNKSKEDVNSDHIIFDAQQNDILYEQYKFVICFENSYAKGYITEKLVNAIAGGAVPIYRGASDLAKYFNVRRIINYDDYNQSYDQMIDRIIALDNNEEQYLNFINQPVFAEDGGLEGVQNHMNSYRDFLKRILTH